MKRTLDHLCGALQQGFFGCCCHVNCQFNPRIAPRDNQRCTMYTILLWWSWWSINTVSSKIGNLEKSYYVLFFFCGHKVISCGVQKFLKYIAICPWGNSCNHLFLHNFSFLEHCYHWSKKEPKKSFVNILLLKSVPLTHHQIST